jgi:hypothetical protein
MRFLLPAGTMRMREGIIRAAHFRERHNLRADADVVRLMGHSAECSITELLFARARFSEFTDEKSCTQQNRIGLNK